MLRNFVVSITCVVFFQLDEEFLALSPDVGLLRNCWATYRDKVLTKSSECPDAGRVAAEHE